MRIAVNTRFLLPGKLEGIGWYTHEVVRRMVHEHPDDEFFFLFDRPFDPQFVYAENVVPLTVFPPARHPFLWYAWFEFALPRVFQKISPDVFFSPDAYLSLRARVRTVMTLHDVIPLHLPEQVPFVSRHYYQYFIPRYARRAERVLTISEFVKQDAVRMCNIPADKVAVVPNGCRTGFEPLSEAEKHAVRAEFSEGQPYFFYTGSIHPRKNLHRLIRAFDRFKSNTGAPVKLLIGGRFLFQTGEITDAWNVARHKNDIRFLGYLPENQLSKLMAASLALTYVSLLEGFGLPLLEAMHCDVPVLTSNTSALPEVAGDAAVLVDPVSEDEIMHGLNRLFSDGAMRGNLIEKGRRQREKFSWDSASKAIYDLIT